MKIKTDIKYQFNNYFFSMPIEIDEKGNVYIKDCYSDKEYVISTTNPNKIDTIDYTISKGDKTYTPYELLTSYYNNNFNPFEKGKIYIGASMSLEDRTQ